ncbi:MAG: YtxH domain-containing protein [Desulfovibrio sp.]
MSDTFYKTQPAPGTSSAEGAFSRNPGEPTYYFQDANMYAGTYPNQAQPLTADQVVDRQQVAMNDSVKQPSTLQSWFNVTDVKYLAGAALGAGVAYAMTNEKVQKTVVSGAVRLWAGIQGGVEEVKEQVQDIKAEMSREG